MTATKKTNTSPPEQPKIKADERPKGLHHKEKKGLEHPEYQALEEKLTKAEQKVNEYWNDMLRTRAELENMRKRVERDVANAHKYGLEKFALELLPVIDSMERGLESHEQDNAEIKNIYHGIKLTHDLLIKTCNKFGIEQVSPQGHAFNPDLHEAMSMQEDPKAKTNSVIQVLQKGYTLNGRLIRPALVIVAK